MKKFNFLLICLTFCGLFTVIGLQTSNAQGGSAWTNPVKSVLVTSDTLFKFAVSENYVFVHEICWTHNTDTIKITPYYSAAVKSNSTTAPADWKFCIYPGLTTYSSVADSSCIMIDDLDAPGSWQGMKVEATDSVYVTIYSNYKRK